MASYDFNTPTTSTGYTDFPATIRDALDSVARMLDGTGDTNVPTGAKRINSGQGYRLEEWDGAAWQTRTPQLADALRAANNLSDLSDKAAAFANIVQAATTGALGGVEKATTTEAQNGTADKFPDAAGVKAHWDQRAASAESISGAWDFTGGLSANGSPVLADSDLAAKGGTVPEVDRANTFALDQSFSKSVVADNDINGTGINVHIKTTTRSATDDVFAIERAGTINARFKSEGDLVLGSPTGGGLGSGTTNAEKSYQNGKRNMAAAASSSDPGLAFDTWRTPAAAGTGGTMVVLSVLVYASTTNNGEVYAEISDDASGSGYFLQFARLYPDPDGDRVTQDGVSFYVPPGGAYRVVNSLDPQGSNSIDLLREYFM